MKSLHVLIEEQVRLSMNLSPEDFDYVTHPSPAHLHDPRYYKDMWELCMYLHRFKQKQQTDDRLLLMVDGDYDTDGILAATILTAALDVFGFQYRVHIPSMKDGYGLSKAAIDEMRNVHEKEGNHIGMILTADNGIAAHTGISYANSLGIDVLVTDHHPGQKPLPKAKAIVNPNQPDDLYPFKGNSGACVAWKTMLAYADAFDKEKRPLIERLIVFAGIANVADVMPMVNENRYTVTAALNIIKELLSKHDYKEIANTPYSMYNTVFHALFDILTVLQQTRDAKRKAQKKGSIPLPTNEELFSWYLSPILNAPRRVHDTCFEGLATFLTSDLKTRRCLIHHLFELNDEKSKLRDTVIQALPTDNISPVLVLNTRKGISGLIAGKLAEQTGNPSIVFSHYDPTNPEIVYKQLNTVSRISGSARSNGTCPLNRLLQKVHDVAPGMVTGGGHATAAGFSIDVKDLARFKELVIRFIPEVQEEVRMELTGPLVPENKLILTLGQGTIWAYCPAVTNENQPTVSCEEVATTTFASDVKASISFLNTLRPFGEGFQGQTELLFQLSPQVFKHQWNPNFWKTFKFNLYGVEVLTFDISWAEQVKAALDRNETMVAKATLKLNEFRGTITPQLILSPTNN